jgi:alkylation response protein AidB-like acyl-CoA dehydrogenase
MLDREAPEEYLQMLDDEQRFPSELYEKWVEMGLLSLPFPERYGGQGGDVMDFTIISEEIGRKGYDIAAAYGAVVFLGMLLVDHGTDEQRERILPELMAGRRRLCISITEPEAGSDVGGITTFARRDGDGFVLDGHKMFCTGAGLPDTTIFMFARTTQEDPRGVSCFLVPNDAPGLELVRLRTLGRRVLGTYQVHLDNVRVGEQDLVGEVDGAWQILLSGLERERAMACAAYVGNAQTVVDQALAHAREREQFGRPIGDFQAIAHMLADMQTEVDAARLLTYRAAWLTSRGKPARTEVSMAKLFGSEMFARVANQGMQILGGYSYLMDLPMQRHFRDARITTVTAGTSQIQRNQIARGLGLRPR